MVYLRVLLGVVSKQDELLVGELLEHAGNPHELTGVLRLARFEKLIPLLHLAEEVNTFRQSIASLKFIDVVVKVPLAAGDVEERVRSVCLSIGICQELLVTNDPLKGTTGSGILSEEHIQALSKVGGMGDEERIVNV